MNQSLFTEQLEAMRGRVTTLNDIVTGSPADLAAAIPATFAELSTAM
ncbi:MAG: hypothetical protein HYX51_04650, partial [Chloroflexi bacterium]|nr:hypothetical protein [Chloroflexota bacterium]